MLIDTHAHLWLSDYYPASRDQPGYYNELESVLKRAKEAGVEKMIVPGTDIESSKKAVKLAKKYPGVLYAAVGIHPEELVGHNLQVSPGLADTRLNILRQVQDLFSGRDLISTVVAIGEIGTDASTAELKNCMGEQKELFRQQCQLALENDLPIIVHTRESLSETLQVLDSLPKMPKGQFHCFSHDETGIKAVLERGFFVSFCGNITWSKRVAKLVSLVPDERLLLETDSPFMMPRVNGRVAPSSATREQPSESQNRNEPANVRILAEKIAELRGQDIEKIAEMTSENANTLYKL